MKRPNLKAQVLTELDSDREVILESKYIPLIWGSEELIAIWCDSWNLDYSITTGQEPRERHGMRLPIYWLTITRKNRPDSLSLESSEAPDELEESSLERSELEHETDASL